MPTYRYAFFFAAVNFWPIFHQRKFNGRWSFGPAKSDLQDFQMMKPEANSTQRTLNKGLPKISEKFLQNTKSFWIFFIHRLIRPHSISMQAKWGLQNAIKHQLPSNNAATILVAISSLFFRRKRFSAAELFRHIWLQLSANFGNCGAMWPIPFEFFGVKLQKRRMWITFCCEGRQSRKRRNRKHRRKVSTTKRAEVEKHNCDEVCVFRKLNCKQTRLAKIYDGASNINP